MMKRVLYALFGLALLFVAQAAWAQNWTSSTYPSGRTPSWPGGGNASYTGVVGDGSDAQGGVAPGFTDEAADIASNFTTSSWITANGARTASSPGQEAKFRTHCNASHEKQEDPILFPGQANIGHLHTFFGNSLAGKDSTYTSLRTTGKGTCAGGALNRTGYWFPSVRHVLPSGVTATIKPDFIVVYYTGDAADAPKLSRFPRNFAYIGGVNPSDYNDTARKAEIPSGFNYVTNGFDGWKCISSAGAQINTAGGQVFSKRLKEANGTDPWGGACVAGSSLVASVKAPPCWDGYNLRSPNGRDHLRYKIRHGNSGALVCPTGWYWFAEFEGTFWFSHNGFSDYGNWYLSSDRMNASNTPGDGTSLSPCRQTGPYFCGGETFHFDWFGAWDYGTAASPGVMIKWMVNCTGVKITISGTTLNGNPGACNDSTIDATSPTPNRVLTNGDTSPDTNLSNNPVINLGIKYFDDAGNVRHFPIIPGSTGDATLHHGVPPPGGMTMNDLDTPFMLADAGGWSLADAEGAH